MKFGYTIVYVSDVRASLNFFEKAFGLKTRFLHLICNARMERSLSFALL